MDKISLEPSTSIIEHTSNYPFVKWYIDSMQELDADLLRFHGWIFHQKNNITDITVNGTSVNPDWKPRRDVLTHYGLASDKGKIGFTFEINRNLITEPFSITLDNKKVIKNVANLKYYYTLYSGFHPYPLPIIVRDNFYRDPDAIRDHAINNLTYVESDYHKGRRAVETFILPGTKEYFEKLLGKRIINWDNGTYANGKFQYCIAQDPIVYHVDTQQYAGIVFLTPDAPLETGTSFYKSRFTGRTRFEEPLKEEDIYFKTFSGNSKDYNLYDKTLYDKIDEVGNVYNRLVLWDAKNIHAASAYFGDHITNSRFFQLFFFDTI